MTAPRHRRIGVLGRLIGVLGAAVLLTGSGIVAVPAAQAASGDPVTYPPIAGGDARITLDHSTFAPGETVRISGTGFVGTDGRGGVYVAVKPDDGGFAVTSYGGPDAVNPGVAGGLATFSSHDDGTFSGTVTLPADLSTTGPGTGANAGQHWLRFLAGTYGNPSAPMSFQAYFAVAATPTGVAPTVTTQPTDTTVTAGQDATFTAVATGDPTPTVRWQSASGTADWTDVSGATGTTLSVPNAVVSISGTRYRAVFGNASGTVTSNPATLTVTSAGDGGENGPVTYHPIAGGDATITLDHGSYAPGATVTITGSGFLGTDGHGGVHIVVKPDDLGFVAASYGGPDAYAPGDSGGLPTFVSHDDGTFSGTVTLPADLPSSGPGTGANAGQHWLRFLAGTYGNPTAPKSFQAWFTVSAGTSGVCRPDEVAVTDTAGGQTATACIQRDVTTGAGKTIHLSGAGWKSTDGKGGAKVIVKLASRVSPTASDFQFVHTGQPGDAILLHPLNGNPDPTMWAIIQADATGSFDTTVPVPQAFNVPGNIASGGALAAGQKLVAHFQTGLIPTDTQHSVDSTSLIVDGTAYPGDQDAPVTRCTQSGDAYQAHLVYPAGQAENPTTGPVFHWGETVELKGTGWCNSDPARGGSEIAIKLDDGAYARRPGELVNANNQVWTIIDVDSADGSFDVTFTLPERGDVTGGTVPAYANGVHSFRLLTGSLKAGDPVRTFQTDPFTVGVYQPTGIPLPVNYDEDLTDATNGGVTVARTTSAITVRVPGAGKGDWIFLTAYQDSDGSPRYPWGTTWFRADAQGTVTATLSGVTLPVGTAKLAVQSDADNGRLLGWARIGAPPATTTTATTTTTRPATSPSTRTTASSSPVSTPSSTGITTAPDGGAARPPSRTTVPAVAPPVTPGAPATPAQTTGSPSTSTTGTTTSVTADAVGRPGTTPAPPFPDGDGLTAGNAGGLTAAQDETLVTITIPDAVARPGDWVFVYAYSTPLPAGWTQVDAQHHLRVDVGRLPAGQHKIVVLKRDGSLGGWVAATVAADETGPPAASTGAGAAAGAGAAGGAPNSPAGAGLQIPAVPAPPASRSNGLSGNDWLLIIAAVVLAAAAVGGVVLYRRRGSSIPMAHA